ncbi:transglutaminase domain-containing protein [bacterium]|nr:transglutaminase domain-containing protein [bacterium]
MRVLCILAVLLFYSFQIGFAGSVRRIEATYTATIESIPSKSKQLEVWIPMPAETPAQSILALNVESPYPAYRALDREYGNTYLYMKLTKPVPQKLIVSVRFEAERREVLYSKSAGVRNADPSSEVLNRFLKPSRLATISPRIWKLADEITKGHASIEDKARAIYDYVAGNIKYDKTIPGWGRGDTERVCDVRTGNCTDFHSLFISLARASHIPARFIIGLPLAQKVSGTVTGYHCWADFYLPGHGWVPVDASEASKSNDPGKRDYLFGNLDPDRLEFTIGRDIRLNPPQSGEPLNYFIYPYAEADGKPLSDTRIQLDYVNLPLLSHSQDSAVGSRIQATSIKESNRQTN